MSWGNGFHYAETQVEEFFINLNVVLFFLSPKFLMCLAISHLLYSDLLFITSPPPLLAILTASCSCLDRAELWNLTGLMWKFGSPCPLWTSTWCLSIWECCLPIKEVCPMLFTSLIKRPTTFTYIDRLATHPLLQLGLLPSCIWMAGDADVLIDRIPSHAGIQLLSSLCAGWTVFPAAGHPIP